MSVWIKEINTIRLAIKIYYFRQDSFSERDCIIPFCTIKQLPTMKIICFIIVLIEITKEGTYNYLCNQQLIVAYIIKYGFPLYDLNLYFLCSVHSLNCSVHEQDEEQQHTVCKLGEPCGYTIVKSKVPNTNNTIFRSCLTKDGWDWSKGKCIITSKDTICACDTDYCNNYCFADKCPEQGEATVACDAKCTAADPATTTPTDATTTNKAKTNPTDDNSRATSYDGPQPTYDSTGATDEDGPQPTKDGTGATGEDRPQPTEDRSGATAEESEETPKPTGKASANIGNLRVVESNQSLFALLILITLVIRSSY